MTNKMAKRIKLGSCCKYAGALLLCPDGGLHQQKALICKIQIYVITVSQNALNRLLEFMSI